MSPPTLAPHGSTSRSHVESPRSRMRARAPWYAAARWRRSSALAGACRSRRSTRRDGTPSIVGRTSGPMASPRRSRLANCPRSFAPTAQRSTAMGGGTTSRPTEMCGSRRLPPTGVRTPRARGGSRDTGGPGLATIRGHGRRIITAGGVSRAHPGTGFPTASGVRRG